MPPLMCPDCSSQVDIWPTHESVGTHAACCLSDTWSERTSWKSAVCFGDFPLGLLMTQLITTT